MGKLGGKLGSAAGGAVGAYAGKRVGAAKGGVLGGIVGGFAGGQAGSAAGKKLGAKLIPFKKGGKVPGGKDKAVPAMLHGGEYVLPANVKPTKAQIKQVAKIKAK